MQFYSTERTALFIDGASLRAGSRSLDFDVDFRRLRALFASQTRLVRAIYYALITDATAPNPLRSLVDWLDYNGYTVITKPVKFLADAEGRQRARGSVGVELAVDTLRLAPHLDHLVLFSGDGDLRRLVEALQQQGKRVTVVSSLMTQPPMISDELRRQADSFVELGTLKSVIARTDRVHRGARTETSRTK